METKNKIVFVPEGQTPQVCGQCKEVCMVPAWGYAYYPSKGSRGSHQMEELLGWGMVCQNTDCPNYGQFFNAELSGLRQFAETRISEDIYRAGEYLRKWATGAKVGPLEKPTTPVVCGLCGRHHTITLAAGNWSDDCIDDCQDSAAVTVRI